MLNSHNQTHCFGLKRATTTHPLYSTVGGVGGGVLLKNITRRRTGAGPTSHYGSGSIKMMRLRLCITGHYLPMYLHILKYVWYYLSFYSTALLFNQSFSVQFDNKVFLSLIYIFSVCFETDLFFRLFRNGSETPKQTENNCFWFRETNRKINRNRLNFSLYRIFCICFEDSLTGILLSWATG
jgi:hypothetical protein